MLAKRYLLKDGSIYWHKLYFDIVPKWMTKYSPPFGAYNYAHYLYQPHKYFGELYDEVRYFIQRGQRGFSDRDVWSIDYYMCSWMPQALEQLRRTKHGTPIGLTPKQWDSKLDRMINAFKIARKIQDFEYIKKEEYQVALKQFRKDFNVINTYFFNLWD